MTKVEVDSRICGYKAIIKVEKEGKEINVWMESSCKNISDFADKLGPLTTKDLFYFDSKVYNLAGECHLHPSCLVLCGLFNAARIELKIISKALALREKEITIKFLE